VEELVLLTLAVLGLAFHAILPVPASPGTEPRVRSGRHLLALSGETRASPATRSPAAIAGSSRAPAPPPPLRPDRGPPPRHRRRGVPRQGGMPWTGVPL